MRRTRRASIGRRLAGGLALAVLVAACTGSGPASSAPPSHPPDPDQLRLLAEARAALARWADAVSAAHGATGFVPVGELTGLIGAFEEAVGENDKLALYSGVVEAAVQLPTEAPADGWITWADGTVTSVPLIAATQALADIRTGGVQPCPDCQPLRVTGARLTSQPFSTSRGNALVPMWAFTIEGTAARVTRVAVASPVTPVPPPWDANDPPIGISIYGATIAADGWTLTASFPGAGYPATEPCGADYWAEAVESDLAVVVLVHEVSTPTPAVCDAMAHGRTAVVRLASPLGSRSGLEVREGLPVPVTPD